MYCGGNKEEDFRHSPMCGTTIFEGAVFIHPQFTGFLFPRTMISNQTDGGHAIIPLPLFCGTDARRNRNTNFLQ
jgi:hypothetical protein